MAKDAPSSAELLTALHQQRVQAEFIRAAGKIKFESGDVESSIHQLAASHLVVQFSALLDDVPESARTALPDLPWGQVRGMRNRLAHGYGDVDSQLLWQVVAVDLPRFVTALAAVLGAR